MSCWIVTRDLYPSVLHSRALKTDFSQVSSKITKIVQFEKKFGNINSKSQKELSNVAISFQTTDAVFSKIKIWFISGRPDGPRTGISSNQLLGFESAVTLCVSRNWRSGGRPWHYSKGRHNEARGNNWAARTTLHVNRTNVEDWNRGAKTLVT